MAIFTFDAPNLFDDASPPGALRAYVRRKRLLCWIKGRLAAQGVETLGPIADENGWRLSVNAEDGEVAIRVAGAARPYRIVVEKLGEADAEYEDTLAAFEHALPSCEFDLSA